MLSYTEISAMASSWKWMSNKKVVLCNHTLVEPLTQYRNGVWRGRHGLRDHEQEDDKCQEDGCLQADLLARLHRQEEAEKGDEEDEEARTDEIDYIEETASPQVNSEGHVRVELVTAGVLDWGAHCCYIVYPPLLQVTTYTYLARHLTTHNPAAMLSRPSFILAEI